MEECPICAEGRPTDVVVELDASWVTAPRAAALPGYVCVVARHHVAEPYELEGLERRRYWEELLWVAEAVRAETGAAKMNYEIHGNTVPHLHTHLFPRYPGDPFEGRSIDGSATSFERTSEEIEVLAEAVRRRVGEPPVRESDLDVRAVYDDMASWFEEQSRASFYNAHYDRPAVLELVGDVSGQRVLDAGCGAGHYFEALRSKGAEVVGVDGSAELLARARDRLGDDVELVHHDLNAPLRVFEDASFDGVVSALVYHHLDDRTGFLAELRRVLRGGGWLVFSTSHPVADWFQGGGSYFDVLRTSVDFDPAGGRYEVPFWRMPLTTLLDEVLGAGFRLERLVEPVPPPESREVDERLYRRLTREPAFLTLRCTSPEGRTERPQDVPS